MFSNKDNVNILTALLRQKGIRQAVVCPGSRNAPLVHNLSLVMDCVPVTDERSAGFYAIGLAQATGLPVVVCVTSGSALLNVAPAAAEAFYQHIPIIIISADRPERWIDQLDGQTLWQSGALDHFVRRSVSLPEEATGQHRWHCNRLVNEALLAATASVPGPVHINVPLDEPLYDFTVRTLPRERLLKAERGRQTVPTAVLRQLLRAERPMVVIGQEHLPQEELAPLLGRLRNRVVVLAEHLTAGQTMPFEAALPVAEREAENYAPDFVLYMGGTLVSKRLRQFLRQCQPRDLWEVDSEGLPHDTFMQQSGIITAQPLQALRQLDTVQARHPLTAAQAEYVQRWNQLMAAQHETLLTQQMPFSEMSVVRLFENRIANLGKPYQEHYANSTAVRLGNLFSRKKIWCNRGVNGIEGSLSTAAGFSLAATCDVFCVIGDLSFFYDQNALWNDCLHGNLRILLLNNGGGGIFRRFPLDKQEQSFSFITGQSHRTAEGACLQHHVDYLTARDEASLREALEVFVNKEVERAVVLEVFMENQ